MISQTTGSLITGLFILLSSVACERDRDVGSEQAAAADLIFLNGYIYTVDEQQSIAQAVAVRDGEIIALGSNQQVEGLRGPETRVEDLGGKMMLPGLHDSHMHLFGIVEPDICSLRSEAMTLEAMVPRLKECVARYELAAGEWLAVDMWNFAEGNQTSAELPNLRAALDAVSSEQPIILWGNDGHHGAVNSAALARALNAGGEVVPISAETLNTDYRDYRELIGVDASGEPDGGLNEQARDLFGGPVRRDPAVLGALLPQIGDKLASLGLTSVLTASLEPEYLPYVEDFSATGDMRFRLLIANRLDPINYQDPDSGETQVDTMMGELRANRDRFAANPLISANAAKIYVDGVLEGNPLATPPTLPNGAMLSPYKQPRISYDPASGTAAILGYVDTGSEVCQEVQAAPERHRRPEVIAAFMDRHGFHPGQCTVSRGVYRDQESFVHDYVRRLDEGGFTIHIHAIGDRAARVAVDALQGVMSGSENSLRHGLAHLQVVHPDDQRRMGELGLYLAYTFAWMGPVLEYDMTVIPFIEELGGVEDLYDPKSYYMQNVYPVRSTLEAGAVVVGGSDAPVDDLSPRPLFNMAGGVTRIGPDGNTLNAVQTIDIHQMIRAYTLDGARAMSQEDLVGSIEVGKRADLAVLERNIVELYEAGQALEILDTQVNLTVFDGEIIYRRE